MVDIVFEQNEYDVFTSQCVEAMLEVQTILTKFINSIINMVDGGIISGSAANNLAMFAGLMNDAFENGLEEIANEARVIISDFCSNIEELDVSVA